MCRSEAGEHLQPMPPKKRSGSKKKKEVLQDPNTISNGECNYYIGSWSYYQSIDAVSDIAHTVLQQHTSADEEVGTLPRTNILLQACKLGDASTHYAVEVADNMVVESVPRSFMENAEQLKKELSTDGEEALKQGETASVQEQVDSSPVVSEKLKNELSMDGEEALKQGETASVQEDIDSSPVVSEPDVGASRSSRDVILEGTVHIDGIVTRIVIKPDLPEPPAPPPIKRGRSVKRKKSSKLIEEEQRRLAEAARIYEEKVNAAVAAAREEEEYQMQFAHPNRWPHVVFSNMTFAGQVIVSHAHVTFRNCRFSASGLDITQLLVTQYCEVECIKCTFECPAKGSVYGFPRSKLTFRKCLFTGSSNMLPSGILAKSKDCKQRLRAVGLHTDCSRVMVEDSQFTELETAILLRGSHPDGTAGKPGMVVQACKMDNIFGTGVVLDGARGVELTKNKFSECEYYSLDCVKGKDIRVFQNRFYSQVRVQERAEVKFMHNKCGTVPLSLQEVDNPNWQPVY
ncbi:hypothetical protein TraAM80_07643 [Trypanosoma rangeli]|uniref:Right handed beta helix domain-containing protein n=1 Tax=Trypanosoma rangeli TaxID=5698 RepID=A0A422N4J7_TRYRA|nr:uncharacterized protein TraAM80_07643 [Trypanosoma rangeli]RNF00385.1 hypothetical protein TraAM80_07643 [Trypanosoma rangeli]|eukprot:RNF00385.1 hypothetical protein TraAM80_07643 [Trypanosoma rangeli]